MGRILTTIPLFLILWYSGGTLTALGSVLADDDKPGIVKGKIIDDKTQQPMEFANVALYNVADSSLITGTITGENGEFEIQNLPYGEYYLEANFVGFERIKTYLSFVFEQFIVSIRSLEH